MHMLFITEINRLMVSQDEQMQQTWYCLSHWAASNRTVSYNNCHMCLLEPTGSISLTAEWVFQTSWKSPSNECFIQSTAMKLWSQCFVFMCHFPFHTDCRLRPLSLWLQALSVKGNVIIVSRFVPASDEWGSYARQSRMVCIRD